MLRDVEMGSTVKGGGGVRVEDVCRRRDCAKRTQCRLVHSGCVLRCVCCSVLQCVAVCCSMRTCVTARKGLNVGWCTCALRCCVALCCRVLQSVVACCSVLQYEDVDIAKRTRFGLVHCVFVLQCVCCSVLQSVVVCCSVLQYEDVDIAKKTRFGLVHYVCVLQCVAVCCSVLQCVAVCCSIRMWTSRRKLDLGWCTVFVCCSVCVAVCCIVL